MVKYNKYTLKKIEELFEELGYRIRYERGSFQSGYCMVQNQNIIVINRFFETEARINTLLDILQAIDFDSSRLSDRNRKYLRQLEKHLIELPIENN